MGQRFYGKIEVWQNDGMLFERNHHNEVLEDFMNAYPEYDPSFSDGDTTEELTGNQLNEIIKSIVEFTKKYPNLLFKCFWEDSYGGHDGYSVDYIINGQIQSESAEITYPVFDKEKLEDYA